MAVDVLAAQVGNARIRKMHKEPLVAFLKDIEQMSKEHINPNADVCEVLARLWDTEDMTCPPHDHSETG